jgi:hypothetical protein
MKIRHWAKKQDGDDRRVEYQSRLYFIPTSHKYKGTVVVMAIASGSVTVVILACQCNCCFWEERP